LLSTSCLAAPALAQSVDEPAPVRERLDENGVDLTRGTFKLRTTQISIGPEGPGGLSLVREHGLESWSGRHNYSLMLFDNGDGTWSASLGLASHLFTRSGSLFTAADGSGAKLVDHGNDTYTLTTADGTIVEYDYAGAGALKARGSSITYPTDDKVTLTWVSRTYCTAPAPGGGCYGAVATRLQSVSSSSGYRLHFGYAAETIANYGSPAAWYDLNKVTALNTVGLTAGACDPADHVCSPPTGSPYVTYNSDGSVTDALGRTSHIWVSGSTLNIRRPSKSTGANVTVTHSGGKVASLTRDGLTWDYNYSSSGDIATMTVIDPLGHTKVVTSKLSVGLPTSVKNELGDTTTYAYDSYGRLDIATFPEGNSVDYAYDARGNVTSVRRNAKPGTTEAATDIVTSATYSSTCTNTLTCNKPVTTTDALGNVTNYSWNATHGGLATVTLPAPATGGVRPQTRYTYSSIAVPDGPNVYRLSNISACETTASCNGAADEVETIIAYGGDNKLPTSITKRAGNGTLAEVSTMTYDDIGNLATVDGPLSGTADTVRYHYDAARQLVGTVSPDPDGGGALKPRAQRLTYNLDGQVEQTEVGTVVSPTSAISTIAVLETATVAYDAAGRPIKQTLAGATGGVQAVTQMNYDEEGRLNCTAVRMNPTYFASATDACQVNPTHATYGQDRISRTYYDAADRVVKVESGVDTVLRRDDVLTTYGDNGETLTVTDGNGNKTTYEYDGHFRLERTRYPSPATDGVSSTTDDELLTYDLAGNVLTRTLRDGAVISYGYDDLNRLISKNLPNAVMYEWDVTYGYDNLGRLVSAADTNNQTVTFGYDVHGRKTSEGNNYHGTKTFLYDTAGRRTRMTWKDGFYVTYDYLVTGEMAHIRENGAASGVGVLATFAYDDMGRRTSLTRGNGTVTSYSYDTVSRLDQMVDNLGGTAHDITRTFAHNPAGQITSLTRSNNVYAWDGAVSVDRDYTSNGLNQYTMSGTIQPTYDLKGNLTQAGGVTYGYTAENRLTTTNGAPAMAYNPVGQLYYVNEPVSLGYDGPRLVEEFTHVSGFPIVRRYVHGPGMDEPLVWYEGAGTSDRRFLHADERGSIVAVTNSTGGVIAVNSYDEYGIPSTNNLGRFQYTGQAWLPKIGMYFYKNRIYSPTMGRFLQTDPIGYDDGMNLYAYVGNDPVNFVDPWGLATREIDKQTPVKCVECITVSASLINWTAVSLGNLVTNFNSFLLGGSLDQGAATNNEPIVVTGKRINKATPAVVQAPAQSSNSSCQAPIDEEAYDAGLQALGIVGDGLSIVGLLTANPVLFAAGRGLSALSTVGSVSLNTYQGDVGGLASDAVGAAAGLVPGGRLMRGAGGAAADAGRNSGGRFVTNWSNRQRAQDLATAGTQERVASAAATTVGCQL
jgi:RHS repeat-associated protein